MNHEDIIERLEKILRHYELSASVFADKINVQRSSLSHLLNGRNKPSLDFILKVDHAFPEVDLYWLLYGRGVFPSQIEKHEEKKNPSNTNRDISKNDLARGSKESVDRIVIFYKDGTFRSFTEQ